MADCSSTHTFTVAGAGTWTVTCERRHNHPGPHSYVRISWTDKESDHGIPA